MKVWVLTQGDFSSYAVVGVFSDPAIAETVKAGDSEMCNRFNDLEEYDLDQLIEWRVGQTYTAYVYLDSGKSGSHPCAVYELRHPLLCAIRFDTSYEEKFKAQREIVYVASPLSFAHALKVAIEKRQEWLRTRDLSSTPASTGEVNR